jgi:hypothetical protein
MSVAAIVASICVLAGIAHARVSDGLPYAPSFGLGGLSHVRRHSLRC